MSEGEGHGHGHGGSHGGHSHAGGAHVHGGGGNLAVAFALNLAFTLIEFAGGLWTNSIAILSDAVHDLGDSISLGLAWHFDRVARKGRTPRNTYGYRRYALLGGLITAFVLVIGISFVLWNAAGRLFDPQPVNAQGMMVLAVLGVAFNGAAVLRVRKGSSLTERVVSWHLLEDTLGWVAVLVGAGVMSVWNLPIIDPLLSIGISLFVLFNVARTLRQFFWVFLQRAPAGFDVEEFEREARLIPGVAEARHTHSWSIDGQSHVLTTHLAMKPDASPEQISGAKAATRALLDAEAFEHVTIEIDAAGEEAGHRGTKEAKEEGGQ
ncbi:cation transporter [Ramlibacter rhizophilus]|uniref:Cation transporter n=1 Tax=Ramlibacter rhizophilus TaxID=1781167 RepID=A0A4Z0C2Z2_9BURK|nr:cation transporter [Ramlibacter rhizophilus]